VNHGCRKSKKDSRMPKHWQGTSAPRVLVKKDNGAPYREKVGYCDQKKPFKVKKNAEGGASLKKIRIGPGWISKEKKETGGARGTVKEGPAATSSLSKTQGAAEVEVRGPCLKRVGGMTNRTDH